MEGARDVDAPLFEAAGGAPVAPLADRLRPARPEDVRGQAAVLAPGTLLGEALDGGPVPSVVLWGPPGTGKTTLARLLARRADLAFASLSAVTSGVKDVRAVIRDARARVRRRDRTLLFVDEIHRFNRAQQDAFLPHIEDGTITLVGATTENPGFALIGALLSRMHVVTLEPLGAEALGDVLDRALAAPEGLAGGVVLDGDVRALLVEAAGGDARRLLNLLEAACALAGRADAPGPVMVGPDAVREAAQTRTRRYDRRGDDRYDLLSAFHKALRGSDVDAALYWMARMLVAGEDPLVLARRMVAMAAEDIGVADPTALRIALDAKEAVAFLGQPEGELAVAEAVIHLATAPKSNSVVRALRDAKAAAAESAGDPVPLHLRNAPTPFARGEGHGTGYRYPHDHPDAVVAQSYLPPRLTDLTLYAPGRVGQEREVARRARWWRGRRAAAAGEAGAASDGPGAEGEAGGP